MVAGGPEITIDAPEPTPAPGGPNVSDIEGEREKSLSLLERSLQKPIWDLCQVGRLYCVMYNYMHMYRMSVEIELQLL